MVKDSSPEVKVTFLPCNRTIKARRGANLLDLAHEAVIDLHNSCDGSGTCGKCTVSLLEGEVSPITREELTLLTSAEIARGVRLACRTQVLGDARVKVVCEVDTSSLRILEDGFCPKFSAYRPAVRKACVQLEKPSLTDGLSDAERVERAVGAGFSTRTALVALRSLPGALRDSGFNVSAVLCGDEILGIEAGDTTAECYGLALDIGTTTVVASLIDLSTGIEAGTASCGNPQARHGQDVLTRIGHTGHPGGLEKLRRLIIRKINELARAVCENAGVSPRHVYEVVVAGNATMVHLLLGVPPASLGVSPYVTAFRRGLTAGAAEVGLGISEYGQVHVLPSVSAYVGADIVAGIVATGLHESRKPALLVDVGTNGEIAFGSKDGMVACSCAAGPALEGMNISCGTIAVEGAIETVSMDGSVEFETIGGADPIGICGSGIIDAVAALLNNQVVDRSGRILPVRRFLDGGGNPSLACRISERGEVKFILAKNNGAGQGASADGIFVSQKDIRQVQLAKGAISSGMQVLLKEVGVSPADIDKVYVAGAFGQHLRRESLVRMGLVPQELSDKVVFVGNSSKTGAALCLLSLDKRAEAEEIAGKIRYFELSVYPGYDRLFVEALAFPA